MMAAFLAVQHQMRQPHFPESLFGEFPVLAFGFLQADHIGPLLRDERFDIRCAQADRIDVPADNLERLGHGALRSIVP